MANKYAITAGGNWSAAALWDNASSGGAGGDGKPGAGDTPLLDVGSGNVTVDEATAALGGLTMTLYTNTLAVDNAIDVNSGADLDGIITGAAPISVGGTIDAKVGVDFSGYTGILTHDGSSGAPDLNIGAGVTLPDFVIDNAGVDSFTLQDDMACGKFTVTDGKFDADGNAMTFTDDVTYVAGTVALTGVWTFAASLNLDWTTSGNRPASIVVNTGVTVTLAGISYTSKVADLSGTITGAQALVVIPTADDWWTQGAGTFSAPLQIQNATNSPGGDIVQTGATRDIIFRNTTGAKTITMDANISSLDTITVKGDANSTSYTVAMGENSFTAGTLSLGDGDSSGIGILTTAGPLVIGTGGILSTAGGSGTNVLTMTGEPVTCTGTFDGTRITVTSAGVKFLGTPTIQDVTVVGAIQAPYATDGSNNTNVRFYHRRMQRVDRMDMLIA